MRKFALFGFLLSGFSGVQSLVYSSTSQNCTGIFTPVSASAAFAALNPGWNLGNTLDATPDEGSWNNPPVKATTFSEVQAKGFKSVRIPGMCSGLGVLPVPDNVQSHGRITLQIPHRHRMSILFGWTELGQLWMRNWPLGYMSLF